MTDPGFGSYWTVNLDAPPGTKRPRKRGRANREPGGDGPRRRGRPRKVGAGGRGSAELDDIEPPLTGLHRMNIDGDEPYDDGFEYLPDDVPRLRSVRADDYEDDDDGMYAGYSGSEGLLDVEAASGALSFLVGVE